MTKGVNVIVKSIYSIQIIIAALSAYELLSTIGGIKMCKTNDGQRLGQAAEYLSSKLRCALLNQAAQLSASAQEIRLRVNKPVSVSCADGVFYLTKNGGLSISRDDDNLLCTPQELENTLHKICDYSVYARQGEINRGFVTLSGGHRAGLCGTAVIENGKIVNVRQITSINIRIAREHKNCHLRSAVQRQNHAPARYRAADIRR